LEAGRATQAAFFIAGFGTAAWAPLVPYAKTRLGLDAGALGALLLCLGVGSIVTMPIAGALTARFGCRRVLCGAGLLIAATLPLLATIGNAPLLGLTLAVFGAGFGGFEVAANLQAVLVEQRAQQPVMSGFHALFSVGGLAGAGGVTTLLWAGLSPLAAALGAVVVILAVLAAAGGHFLADRGEAGAPVLAFPRGPVFGIGVLCFIVFLAEAAMLDWSALVMTILHGVPRARAGLGYAAFAIAMALGRLIGDRLVRAVGGPAILAGGGSCAAIGLCLAVFAPDGTVALGGFALVGLGASNIVPVLFSAVGRQTRMPPALAVAGVSTIGTSGILTGPALIGFVAQATSLSFAFVCVAGLMMAVALSARVAPRL
jgi:predicted MFS family arabinose efflux permease